MQLDLHTHSTYSMDGHDSMADMCRRAVELELQAIAFTDHVEWLPGGEWLTPDFPAYFEELAQVRARFAPDGLQVLSGVEFGNPHEHRAQAEEMLSRYDFDVIIGSIHWLGDRNIHLSSAFDGREPYDVYGDYFGEMAVLAREPGLDMVAHFDRIFQAGVPRFGLPDIRRVEGPVRRALEAMVDNACLLELNTRFLAHEPGWNDTIRTVLDWYRDAGGAFVSVNSDAHRVSEVARHGAIGWSLVLESGLQPSGVPRLAYAEK
jgi:histidinol-phosphatase (PHP family)